MSSTPRPIRLTDVCFRCATQCTRAEKLARSKSFAVLPTVAISWEWKWTLKLVCRQRRCRPPAGAVGQSRRNTSERVLPGKQYRTKSWYYIFSVGDSLKTNGARPPSRCLDIHRRCHATPPLMPTTGVNCHQKLLQQRSDKYVDQTMKGKETRDHSKATDEYKSIAKTGRPWWSEVKKRRGDHVIAEDEEDQLWELRPEMVLLLGWG